jgi:hypothetical protein
VRRGSARDLLLYGGFDLGEWQVRLEAPAAEQTRIDAEVGALIIECKRDLRAAVPLTKAEDQLAGHPAGIDADRHEKSA